jgi:hypothetical protein
VPLRFPELPHLPWRLNFAFSVAFALANFVSAKAWAIENEWHVGGGLGVAQPTSTYQLAPLLSLHAAYGVSDMFDVRLTFAGSMHQPDADAAAQGAEKTTLALGTVGLAYKFDVIEWVPYFGVRAGYFHFGPPPPANVKSYAVAGGEIGVMAGVDYSFSRAFALGVEFAYDALLPDGALTSGILHAEYRFGY